MNIGNLECQVCVDVVGHLESLEEYGVEHRDTEGGKTCSAWIPSKVGQRFQVVCRDPGKRERAECCLSTSLYIDGICRSRKKAFLSAALNDHWHRDVRVSSTERRAMQFGALELTDDDEVLQADTRKYGGITLEVWRARLLDDMRPRAKRTFNQGFAPARLNEKTKKGLAHVVVLGEARKIPSGGGIASELLDVSPIATFTFRYRSIDILRAKGIAPNRPSQSVDTKPATSRIVDTSSTARSRKRKASEELRLERPLKRELVDIEDIERDREAVRQAEEALRQARLRLYRQEGHKRVKLEDVSAFIPGEVIDLTDG